VTRLPDLAAEARPAPWSPPDGLGDYKPEKSGSSKFTIDDYPNLADGPAKMFYDVLRVRVLGLDPGVVVAYTKKKAISFNYGTTFVDVVPWKRYLQLTINSPFKSLEDPRGLARDVTNVGHWGQGDVMVRLDSLEEIDYVMSLVRQAFQRLVKAEAVSSPSPADVAE
jgi:predicted transport protein